MTDDVFQQLTKLVNDPSLPPSVNNALRTARNHYLDETAREADREENDKLVVSAFAERREDFLGPGPWSIIGWLGDYVLTPSADPIYLYIVDIQPGQRLSILQSLDVVVVTPLWRKSSGLTGVAVLNNFVLPVAAKH